LWRYHQRNRIDPLQAAVLALASLVCAYLAARFAVNMDARHMRLAFVTFLALLAFFLLLQLFQKAPQGSGTPRYGLPWMGALGLGAGALGGMFGVGGGVVATPVLTSVFGLTQAAAQGLALALAAPSTAMALATYAGHGHVDWSTGLALALGGMLSVSWGVRMAHVLPERGLRMAFSAFLVVCALMLAVRA